MVRDAALRSAFISLFALLCGIERDQVRPDCHQSSHQNHLRVPTSPTDLRSFSFTAQRLAVWRQKVVLWIVFEAGNFSIVSPKLVVETCCVSISKDFPTLSMIRILQSENPRSRLPLFTQSPRRGVPGNRASGSTPFSETQVS